jgi:hypothetical protein
VEQADGEKKKQPINGKTARSQYAGGREWLVAARNEIQALMFVLYQRWKGLDSEKREYAAGAAFSLWRAVFLLAEKELKSEFRNENGDSIKTGRVQAAAQDCRYFVSKSPRGALRRSRHSSSRSFPAMGLGLNGPGSMMNPDAPTTVTTIGMMHVIVRTTGIATMRAGRSAIVIRGTVQPTREACSREASTCPAARTWKSSTTPAIAHTHSGDLRVDRWRPSGLFASCYPTSQTVTIGKRIHETATSDICVNWV